MVLRNLHFVNCSVPDRTSPILVDNSAVTFSDCRFENNRGHNGVVEARGSNLTFHNCNFRQNQANRNGGGVDLRDGSIVVAQGCRFVKNRCRRNGGAITLQNSRASSITDSIFRQNKAKNGGAIYGLISEASEALMVQDCTFEDNQADVDGGALALIGIHANVSETSFISNVGFTGGALLFSNPIARNVSSEKKLLSIFGCAFRDNNAQIGGAIVGANETRVTIERSSFQDNSASEDGGALAFNDFARIKCMSSSFIDNSAGIAGGAIRLLSNEAASHSDINETRLGVRFDWRDGLCRSNSAPFGGCLYAANEVAVELFDVVIASNFAEDSGGGLYAIRLNSVLLRNVRFDSNTAMILAGAVCAYSDPIPTVENEIPSIGRCSVDIRNCRFHNNTAQWGGGLQVYGVVSVMVEGSAFVSNVATASGGAISLDAPGYDRPDSYNTLLNVEQRGIDTRRIFEDARRSLDSPKSSRSRNLSPVLSMTMDNSLLQSNRAEEIGGALYVVVGCLVSMQNSILLDNNAGHISGAAFFAQSLFFCQYCEFKNNRATVSSGAVAFHVSDLSSV